MKPTLRIAVRTECSNAHGCVITITTITTVIINHNRQHHRHLLIIVTVTTVFLVALRLSAGQAKSVGFSLAAAAPSDAGPDLHVDPAAKPECLV